MLTSRNRLLVQEILHRLELKEQVSVDELIYLHQQAREYAEVDAWVQKLLTSEEFLGIEAELNSIPQKIAA